MRINPNTGEITSEDNDFCPNCDAELMDEYYPYCDRCDEYVGVVVQNNYNYNQNIPYTMTQNDNSDDHSILTRGEKACCGTICLIIFLLWFIGWISR